MTSTSECNVSDFLRKHLSCWNGCKMYRMHSTSIAQRLQAMMVDLAADVSPLFLLPLVSLMAELLLLPLLPVTSVICDAYVRVWAPARGQWRTSGRRPTVKSHMSSVKHTFNLQDVVQEKNNIKCSALTVWAWVGPLYRRCCCCCSRCRFVSVAHIDMCKCTFNVAECLGSFFPHMPWPNVGQMWQS